MKAFLQNYILRPSCYSCFAKNGKSKSDVTISDFWGLHLCMPDFDDDKGVCTIFLHTNKSLDIFKGFDFDGIECSFNDGIRANSYIKSADKPVFRNRFWFKFKNGSTVEKCLEYAQNPSLLVRVVSKVKRTLLK